MAIAAESEVRAVHVGLPGTPFDSLTDVIEGAPQLFPHSGGLVDLARLDWTDGRLVVEVAERPEDIAGLSVGVSPTASVTLGGDAVADTPGAIIFVNCPRAPGVVSVAGYMGRVGGAGGAGTTCGVLPKTADGNATGLTVSGALYTASVTVVATPAFSVLTAPSLTLGGPSAYIRYAFTADAGAVYHGRLFVRPA